MTHETGSLASDEVRGMFDRIAPVYDAMNRVMTVGLDRSWRRLTVEAVVQPGDRVLDACCGTGDLAVAAEREGGVVTGLDFSTAMLDRARRKSDTVEWVEGTSLRCPSRTSRSTPRRSASASATSRASRRLSASSGACSARGAARDPRDHASAGNPAPVLHALVRPDRAAARQGPARWQGLHVSPRERAALSGRRGARDAAPTRGFVQVRFRLLGGSIVALHCGIASGDSTGPTLERGGR